MNIDLLQTQLSGRRDFAKKLGLASAGIAAFFAKVEAQTTVSDSDILNFALNLEYLEAEFYTMATTGKYIGASGLTITGGGTAGVTTGGSMVTFAKNSSLAITAQQIAADEQAHVTLLQGAITSLGGTPIAKPAINLAALGTGFESPEAFVNVARSLEDVGVSAYGGAAPLITSKSILGYAARILATEAEHAANLRLHVSLYQVQTKALDGADNVPPPSGTKYFTTNANGLTPVRTPGQVLYIAFGGAASATSGGFFPSGVNGNASLGMSAATADSSNS